MVRNTTDSREALMTEFLEGRTERAYASGRLFIRDKPSGEGTQLVAYGQQILAEAVGDTVTLFTGHHASVSQTVTNYVKILGRVLNETEGKSVSVFRDSAPVTGYDYAALNAGSAQYINNYVGSFEEMSSVENKAVESVETALRAILDLEFGE